MTRLCTPDVDAALAWLTTGPLVSPSGVVDAWVEPDGRGYPYPEAGALVLRLLAGQRSHHPRITAIRSWLLRCVQHDDLGKGGRRYAFDTAVILAALAEHPVDPGRLQSLGRRVLHGIAQGRIVEPPAAPRWSTVVGPHLARTVIGLRRLRDTVGYDFDPSPLGLVEPLGTGRVVTPPGDGTYLHAMLYGLEGLANLVDLGVDPGRGQERLDVALRWLAEIQNADGSLPAWHDGTRGYGPRPADAVAQAVRLWILHDPDRYVEGIAAGLRFLRRLQTPGGAIRYAETSPHENAWATVFAVQAAQMAQGHPTRPADLL